MSTQLYRPESLLSSDEVITYMLPRIQMYITNHYRETAECEREDMAQNAMLYLWCEIKKGKVDLQNPAHWWQTAKWGLGRWDRSRRIDDFTTQDADLKEGAVDHAQNKSARQSDPERGKCDSRLDNERLLREAWKLIPTEAHDDCYKVAIHLAYDECSHRAWYTEQGWSERRYQKAFKLLKNAIEQVDPSYAPKQDRPQRNRNHVNIDDVEMLMAEGLGCRKIAKLIGFKKTAVLSAMAKVKAKQQGEPPTKYKRTMKA